MPKENKQSNRMQGRGDEKMESDMGMDTDLHKLFLDELADIYNAEQQLTKALPKMAKAAQSDELRDALEQHLEETEEHISRLEQVAESLNETLKKKTCKAMKGLIEEGEEIVKEQKDSSALDAGIIAACQKVEHYEIAGYGSATKWADVIGRNDIKNLLGQTLNEEEQTDRKLTELAGSGINQRAAEHREDEEEELAE